MRIVHISDMHFRHYLPGTAQVTSRLSRRMRQLFARAIDIIRAEGPDLLVVSGDLLDFPLYAFNDPDMLARAEQDLRLIAAMLGRVSCPIALVHGNHDHEELTASVFSNLQEDFSCAGHRVICFHDNEVVNHAPQRLLGERERFLAALINADATPQIHVQHYLAWPFAHDSYPLAYREAQHMRDSIVASGKVRMVLSGHYHPGIEPFEDHGTWFAAAPGFADPPHSFFVYDVSPAGVTCRTISAMPPDLPPQKVVFLDRDGTITNAAAYRQGPDALELNPGAAYGLRRLKDAGFALVVVSNQSAVGYGFVTPDIVASVNDRMALLLQNEADVSLDGVYCSYFTRHAAIPEYYHENHPDRKPNPGLPKRAAHELNLDLRHAFFVGDREDDMLAGRRIGATTILLQTGAGIATLGQIDRATVDFVADDLPTAAELIISNH